MKGKLIYACPTAGKTTKVQRNRNMVDTDDIYKPLSKVFDIDKDYNFKDVKVQQAFEMVIQNLVDKGYEVYTNFGNLNLKYDAAYARTEDDLAAASSKRGDKPERVEPMTRSMLNALKNLKSKRVPVYYLKLGEFLK